VISIPLKSTSSAASFSGFKCTFCRLANKNDQPISRENPLPMMFWKGQRYKISIYFDTPNHQKYHEKISMDILKLLVGIGSSTSAP